MKIPVAFEARLGAEVTALDVELDAGGALELGWLLAPGGLAESSLHHKIRVLSAENICNTIAVFILCRLRSARINLLSLSMMLCK